MDKRDMKQAKRFILSGLNKQENMKSTNPFSFNKIYFIPYILTKLEQIKCEINYICSSIAINKEFDKKLHLNYFLSLVISLKIIIGVD